MKAGDLAIWQQNSRWLGPSKKQVEIVKTVGGLKVCTVVKLLESDTKTLYLYVPSEELSPMIYLVVWKSSG
jgi:hypothetical protein